MLTATAEAKTRHSLSFFVTNTNWGSAGSRFYPKTIVVRENETDAESSILSSAFVPGFTQICLYVTSHSTSQSRSNLGRFRKPLYLNNYGHRVYHGTPICLSSLTEWGRWWATLHACEATHLPFKLSQKSLVKKLKGGPTGPRGGAGLSAGLMCRFSRTDKPPQYLRGCCLTDTFS